ncbi:hypothetical protein QN089_09390 [Kurthia sp. YJT4]|uniref:hypothetical protein n=1 Tax=Kurthia sp. YJT4 TaxID=3049086 RepID=UPI00254A5D0C|nr:hypothetical protein [Kurthia sp. YJT4]WIL37569.1 hypothetical protein QN089_09390 [Kurthia sp. YJT4]
MRPVFVHNSKQYDIVTMQINENNVREICYYDGEKYKFVCEKNDYTKELEMVENLTSHIKWIGRYDDLLDELLLLNEKKTSAFDEAAHDVVHSLVGTTAHHESVRNYQVLSGQVAVIDDVIALVSLLKEQEEGIPAEVELEPV